MSLFDKRTKGTTDMANDTFQKFKSSVNRGITTISVKTSSSLEKTKIRTHIDSLESEIGKLYQSVGENAFLIWQQNGDYGALDEQCKQLQAKKEEVSRLTQELSSIDERDNQILGNTRQDAAPAPAPAPAPQPRIVCPNCGAQYETAVNFCRKCGSKMQ